MSANWTDIKGKYIRDPRYGHRLGKSYVKSEKKKKPGYQEAINDLSTDQYGFVGNGYVRELPKEFSNDEIGIIVLGGSAAMGLGATDNSKTFSSIIESNLRKKIKNKKIYVINAGCGGYSSWDEMIYFLTELILRKPQMVISFTGINDFVMGYLGSKYYDNRIQNTSRSFEDIAESVKMSNQSLSFYELVKFKIKKNILYDKIINFYRSKKGEIKLNKQNFTWGLENIKKEYNKNFVSTFWKNQISLLGACKMHKINYHLYIQPCYFWNNKKKLTNKEKEGIDFDKKLLKEDYQKLCTQYFNDLKDKSKIFLGNFNQDNYIFEIMDKIIDDVEEQCFVDHHHLTNLGHEIVAKKIEKNILSSKIFNQ